MDVNENGGHVEDEESFEEMEEVLLCTGEGDMVCKVSPCTHL